MNELQSKLREVSQSILPIIIYVVFCSLVFVPVDPVNIWRFLVGSFFLFIGLAIFLWGVDQSMTPIGIHMAKYLASAKTKFFSLAFAFLLGFLITVAEPDLLILGQQIEEASAGAIHARFFVILVSAGVGLMISLGALKILIDQAWKKLFTLTYFLIFILAFFASNEFIAFAFDASGATTGAITTPFILAISLGLSKMKGGNSDDDSFGLVGAMSAGPIIATLLYSAFLGRSTTMEGAPLVIQEKGVSAVFGALGHLFAESLFALLPIAILFFFLHFLRFKLNKREIITIVRGLIYSLVGLTFFLAGANEGFMDMGKILGTGLVKQGPVVLVILSFILGYLVVSAEPAVLVLGKQVEEVTGGYLNSRIMGRTLSIGVGIAVALSTLRIVIPSLEIWHFLLLGFALAIGLSWYVDDLFVGIAFDAGGVASGPMAATFVLSFAQGIANDWPTANILSDGFGIIALIAMTPVISILVVGAMVKAQSKVEETPDKQLAEPREIRTLPVLEDGPKFFDLLVVTLPHGGADRLVEIARNLGASGATILHGRDGRGRQWAKYRLALDPQRDFIWFLVESDKSDDLADCLRKEVISGQTPTVVVLPVHSQAGLSAFGTMPEEE